jgi:putative hydrolase of the HAD superfamily
MSLSDKHVFFDLDRTLWDFDANSKKALHLIFHDEKLHHHLNFEVFHRIYEQVNAQLWADYSKGKVTKNELRTLRFLETLRKFKLADQKLSERIGEAYIELSPRQTQLFPGVLETLKELKNIGFQLHIITNGFQEVQFVKLENSGLRDFFDVIVCSEFVGKNKPDPEIFHYAMKEAGTISNNSLMIGDDLRADIFGSTRVGMEAILFDPHKKQKLEHQHVVHDLYDVVGLSLKLLVEKF